MKSPKCFAMGLALGALAVYAFLKTKGATAPALPGGGGMSDRDGVQNLPQGSMSVLPPQVADRRYFRVAGAPMNYIQTA